MTDPSYQLLSMADNTGANLGQPLVIDKAQYVRPIDLSIVQIKNNTPVQKSLKRETEMWLLAMGNNRGAQSGSDPKFWAKCLIYKTIDGSKEAASY